MFKKRNCVYIQQAGETLIISVPLREHRGMTKQLQACSLIDVENDVVTIQ